jgi:SET family sugar efflux transporter-like MFS transporter
MFLERTAVYDQEGNLYLIVSSTIVSLDSQPINTLSLHGKITAVITISERQWVMRIAADLKRFIGVKGAVFLLTAIVVYGMGTGIIAPMSAVYLRDYLHLSKSEIASIFCVSLLLNMILTLYVGIVSDRLKGKKAFPMMAAVLCIIGLLFFMRAGNYTEALTGMTVATAPSGLIMGQLFAMARIHF